MSLVTSTGGSRGCGGLQAPAAVAGQGLLEMAARLIR